eukprot:scaffold4247_cov60-Phaeocystis_antarctica.AAC.9
MHCASRSGGTSSALMARLSSPRERSAAMAVDAVCLSVRPRVRRVRPTWGAYSGHRPAGLNSGPSDHQA